MIFVTVGTLQYPFDRLLRALDDVDEELIVQGGSSTYRPEGATWLDFVEYPELVGYMRQARVVVSHAGVGSAMTAVSAGKRPLVVPRLKRHGEAVDDHQVAFARRLADKGLAVLVEDPASLGAALAAPQEPPAALGGTTRIAADLRAYLEETVGRYSR